MGGLGERAHRLCANFGRMVCRYGGRHVVYPRHCASRNCHRDKASADIVCPAGLRLSTRQEIESGEGGGVVSIEGSPGNRSPEAPMPYRRNPHRRLPFDRRKDALIRRCTHSFSTASNVHQLAGPVSTETPFSAGSACFSFTDWAGASRQYTTGIVTTASRS